MELKYIVCRLERHKYLVRLIRSIGYVVGLIVRVNNNEWPLLDLL